MTKKKRGHPDLQEKLDRPWCYYCERDFDDLKILISHQKAKHFKCERCGRRLNTAGGLNVHMNQVHKETLANVENALPNRQGLDIEIFGMEGIPGDVVETHNQRVIQQHYADEQERAAVTGNPVGGSNGAGAGNANKRPKFESPSDLKKRLAEHKAKKAVQEAGGSSGDVTPLGAGQGTQSPGVGHSPGGFPPAGSPPFMPHQQGFSGVHGSPQPAFSQPYGQPPFSQAAQQPTFPSQAQFPQQQPPFVPHQQPGFASPHSQQYPPTGGAPYSASGQQFPPPGGPQYQPPFQTGPPHQFGAGSPPLPFHAAQNQQPPAPSRTPPMNGVVPQRQGSLPAPPGLPQRPSFGAPHVNAFQLQQMHQGHLPSAPNAPPGTVQSQPSANVAPGHATNQEHIPEPRGLSSSAIAASVDELISTAKGAATPTTPSAEAGSEKKSKKDKDKATRLVYSDEEVSPEEKMSKLPRYAFVPDRKEETVLGTPEGAVIGTVDA